MGPYEVLSHTADTGIVTRADSLEAVIANAAYAMFDLMYDVDGSVPGVGVPLEIAVAAEEPPSPAAPGLPPMGGETEPPDLLMAVLSELLYRSEVDGVAFGDFEVSAEDDRALVRVRGYPVESLEVQGPPIKAVTYHDLRCEPTDDGWVAQVIFDV
jgi:SHS2 domain-containing protein